MKLRANILSPLTDTVTLDGRLDVVRYDPPFPFPRVQLTRFAPDMSGLTPVGTNLTPERRWRSWSTRRNVSVPCARRSSRESVSPFGPSSTKK